ncbi:MAG TPA: glycosyltransferase 87 family protein [Phycisphaerae bacterium]|nr:glycosyltransferase 87 family protein [Phycisphaerae bacterium]
MRNPGSGQTSAALRPAIARALIALAVTAVCGISLLFERLPEAFSPVGQWDFEAYYYALKVYDAGGNPYDMSAVVKAAQGAVWPFLYPHHTFAFFRLFAFDDIRTAKDVYLAARLVCLGALLLLWSHVFVRAGARGWFLAFASVGCNATICRDLLIGNVSIFEQTLIWFGLFALLRGRAGWFCLLIVLAAQFKLLLICLLPLALFAGTRRKWAYLCGSVAACGLMGLGVYLSNPSMARAFARLTLDQGAMGFGGQMNPCSLALLRDAADGLLRSWEAMGDLRPREVADVVYVVFAVAVAGVYVHAVRRGMELRRALLVGILTYVVLAPRMKDYSYIIALVPMFEMIRERISKPDSARPLVLAATLMLAMPGLDMLWEYRPLVLAGWAWLIGVSSAPGATSPGESLGTGASIVAGTGRTGP